MPVSFSTISFGLIFFVIVFMVTVHLTLLDFKSVNAQEEPEIIIKNNTHLGKKDKLVVVSNINLQNIEKKGIIKVVGVINGEDFVKNIPLDKIDETTKKLKATFSMNKDNEFVSAKRPDEFFVCAYHYKNSNNNNIIESVSFDKQNDATTVDYFDCNEGDLKSTTNPTEANLFKAKSQVYNKTFTYYNLHSKPNVVSFDTLGNDTNTAIKSTTNNLANSNIKQDDKKAGNNTKDDDNNNSVQVKIIVPMED